MVGEKCGVGGHDFMSNRDLLDVKVNLPRTRHFISFKLFSPVHLWFHGVGKAEGFPMVAWHGGLLP